MSDYDDEYEEYQEMPEYQGFGASLDYASFRQKKKQCKLPGGSSLSYNVVMWIQCYIFFQVGHRIWPQ